MRVIKRKKICASKKPVDHEKSGGSENVSLGFARFFPLPQNRIQIIGHNIKSPIISAAVQGVVIAKAVVNPGFVVIHEGIEGKVSNPFMDMQHPIYVLAISSALRLRKNSC